MSKQRTNPDYLNGVPELVMLKLLEKRPMYGYQLIQAVKEASGQVLTFNEGCVYPVLHKLERQGFLSSREELANGRSRVVYRVTRSGRDRLSTSVARWTQAVRGVTNVLQGTRHAQPSVT